MEDKHCTHNNTLIILSWSNTITIEARMILCSVERYETSAPQVPSVVLLSSQSRCLVTINFCHNVKKPQWDDIKCHYYFVPINKIIMAKWWRLSFQEDCLDHLHSCQLQASINKILSSFDYFDFNIGLVNNKKYCPSPEPNFSTWAGHFFKQ